MRNIRFCDLTQKYIAIVYSERHVDVINFISGFCLKTLGE